tara:strand:+ start:1249 stop:3255 length:2007 start_codon:yes stop_codon:yes gene_type:complete
MSNQYIVSIMESGEFLDLTITSYSNIFGGEKIKNSIYYGIQTPIDKYIHELEMINENTKDDKSAKRIMRLELLKECVNEISDLPNLPNYIEIFFTIIICWLNGGGDKDGETSADDFLTGNYKQYNKQKLIVTVAGGNIIVIFAKLLKDIIDNILPYLINDLEKEIKENSEKIYNNLTTTNKNIINFMNSKNISKEEIFLNLILRLQNSNKLYSSINENAKSSFSDFDYSLLPNYYKPWYDIKEIPFLITRINNLVVNDNQDDNEYDNEDDNGDDNKEEVIDDKEEKIHNGFALFRIKSLIDCKNSNLKQVDKKRLKESCKNVLKEENFENLFPQAVNESDLENELFKVDNQDNKNCKEYVKFLLEQKENIKKSTIENIDLVKNYFSEKLKNLNEYKNLKQEQLELEAIIFYINYSSYKINKYIYNWEKGSDENNFSKYVMMDKTTKKKSIFKNINNLDYYNIILTFLNLQNIYISNNSFLLRVVGGIFENFLNENDTIFGGDKSFSEDLLDVLIKNKKDISSKCKINPIKIMLVFNKKLKNTSLNYLIKKHVYDALEKVKNSDLGFPDGFNIIINTIITNNSSDINNIDLDEVEIDSIGDLLELSNISDEKEKEKEKEIEVEKSKNRIKEKKLERRSKINPYGGFKNTRKKKLKKNSTLKKNKFIVIP